MDFNDDDAKAFEEFKKMRKGAITKIEIRPEPNAPKPVREKKPRSEKQLQAFERMREALKKKHESSKGAKLEESQAYKAKMKQTHDEADKVKEILPNATVVVKNSKGRPRGVKNSRPTPAYDSDPELEEMPPLEPIEEETVKVLPKLKRVNTKPPMTVEDQMLLYMKKLNGL